MALDAATGQLVLFGGGDYVSLDDTWTWEGHGWRRQHPVHHPPAREHATMAYDAASQQLLLFGGDGDDEKTAPQALSDTWAWNGGDWTQLHPASSPPAAATPHMAYDPTARDVVLLTQFCYCPSGGDQPSTETWTWNGHTWTQRTPLHRPNGEGLTSFQGAAGELSERPMVSSDGPNGQTTAMATDVAAGHVLLVQRVQWADTVPFPTATWTWTGDDWLLAPEHAVPAPTPTSPLLATDTAGGRVLYLDAAAQLWAWKGDGWTRLGDAPSALRRGDAAMALDGDGTLVAVGGIAVAPGGVYGDTWTWSAATGWAHAAGPDEAAAVVPPPVTKPAHGITAAEAMRRAPKELPGSKPVRARAGPERDFRLPGSGGPGGARYVWAVLVTGSFPSGCGGPPPPGVQKTCPPPATNAVVFLEYVSGQFVSGMIPAPAQLTAG